MRPRWAFAALAVVLLLSTLTGLPASASSARGNRPPDEDTPIEDQSAAPKPASDATGAPVFYETTTVTARPVSSAAGAVTVIGGEELAAAGARSGSDVLRAVPGLHLLASGGRAGSTHAWIRGADPNFTLVLLDGIPLNDSTELQGGAVNLEELPAGLVERAEVVRGPQTAVYGMSGLSGVVQLFTPRGEPGPVRAALGAEGGSASLRRGLAHASGPAGRGGWSAGVHYDEERFRIAEDRFEQLDAWAGADLALGDEAALALTARVATGDQDDYPDSSGGPLYGSGERRRTGHDDLALGARLSLGDPAGRRHQLSLGLLRRALDRTSPAVPPLVPASEERTTFSRLRIAWQVPVRRAARTQVDLGASVDGEWGTNASRLKLPPAAGGDVSGDYDEARWSGGAHGALRHQRGAVLVEVALRADATSGDVLQLHPRLGVVWSPGSGATRFRASGGRASKLPSFFALASPSALGGNPDLRPERTVGGEIGAERRFRGAHLDLGATVFLHEYRDLVDFDFDRFTHVNRARVRSRGAELLLRWRPHRTLSIEGEATYLDVEDLSGQPLLHEPRWLGGGRVTWRPSDRWTLRLDAHAVSRYRDRQLPVPDRDSVGGRGIAGFAGTWRAHGNWSLRARIDNLMDREYETLVGFPGPGRSFRAGLGWER